MSGSDHETGNGAPDGASKPHDRGSPRRRILVVDDSPDIADALAEFLASEGFDVQTAFDGPAALERAASFAPDIVLLDIGLPGVDGYEVATRLRATDGGKRLYLVALTGYGGSEEEARSRAAGFDVHLVKPAKLSKLAAVLARAQTAADRR